MKYLKEYIGTAVLFLTFLLALPSFVGADSDTYRFILGHVSRDNGRTLIVNEGIRLRVSSETKVFNSRGKQISTRSLRGHKWIYAEGGVNEDESVTADSIYLLPGYVSHKAKKRYSFIKSH